MGKKIKVMALLLAFALVLNIVMPVASVIAVSSTNSLTITFRDNYNEEQGKVQYSLNDGASWIDVTEGIENQSIVMNGDNLRIRIISNVGYIADFSGMSYRENNSPNIINLANDTTGIAGALTSENGYQVGSNVTSVELASVEFIAVGGGSEDGGREFEGTAWFLWNDNGTLCKYRAEDLVGLTFIDGKGVYPINYIKESDVKDGSHALEIDNIKAGDYVWTWDSQIEKIEEMTSWNELMEYTKALEDEDYDLKRAFLIDPTGAVDAKNTLCTNGDRTFRATIYDENAYEGITFETNEENYTYFLESWDPIFFSSTFDISGTTKASPLECSSYMLEPYLKFNVSENSLYDIASVTALDVNSGAVTITNNLGEYTIRFNSNYYDKVEFEVTDTEGNNYYFLVNRVISEVSDTYRESRENSENTVKTRFRLIYPEDTSYEDYETVATITYKDGTVETRNVEASKVTMQVMDGSFVTDYEFEAGKGLRSAYYLTAVTGDMSSVDYTVFKKGALDSTENYGGTFAGSNKGIHVDLTRLVNDFYGI